MPMYALATIHLIKKLHSFSDDFSQVWYADDTSTAGNINRLHEWWTHLATLFSKFGYFANVVKTWLVVYLNKNLTLSFDSNLCNYYY